MSQEVLYQNQLAKDRQKDMVDLNISNEKKNKKEQNLTEVTSLLRFIFILAIIGDLFGVIPVVGSFLNAGFGIVLLCLYFFNDLGRGFKAKRTARAWLRRTVLVATEAIPVLGMLPMLTTGALIEIFLAKSKKTQKVINKIK